MSERHLHAVEGGPNLMVLNPETGETRPLAEVTAELESEYDALQKKYRSALAQITRLERDSEAEARKHKLWAEASALHDWWALATGHEGTKFGAEEFYQALPRLKELKPTEAEPGVVYILRGIAGIAYDPNTKRKRNGGTERYDSWSTLMGSADKFRRYAERAPGWPTKEHAWKRWLIERIEASFKP